MGLLCFNTLFTQTDLSQILNIYTAVDAIDPCANTLSLTDLNGFEEGMDILIIQMQGAAINLDNNSGFGHVTDLGSAGKYEKNQIASINGNTAVLAFQLLNTYDLAGKVQMVSFPKYDEAVVTDTVKGLPWNGTIGGIVAFQVTDNLRLEAPISANGIGFRGGISDITVNNNCNFGTSANNYFYGTDNWRGAAKGEGIARFTVDAENGRGPQANGGGGGNDHNAGGGGGSNLTKAGQGGTNEEPSFFGCDGNFPGFGGREILSDSTRLFLGGGGGAGHENNDVGTDGGNGGGIIVLSVGSLDNNNFLLEAKGETPLEGGGDGGGGGGGGGSILLLYDQASPIAVNTSGGDGGSINNGNADRCQGPGGGGSGGHVLTNGLLADPAVHASGGTAGLTFNSAECSDGTNGSEPGATGIVTPISTLLSADQSFGAPAILEQASALSLCAGSPLTIGVLTQGAQLTFQWLADQGTGFNPLQNDASFSGVNTDSLQVQAGAIDINGWVFQLQISSECDASFSSDPILVTVLPTPIPDFGTALDGQTVIFNNTSAQATTYHWDFGDGNMSTDENPVHTYGQMGTFTVTLIATNDCGSVEVSNTVTIAGAPNAAFSANPETGCTPMTVAFSNNSSGEISTILWRFPGGTPASSTDNNPNITYNTPGAFDVTLIVSNENGIDSVLLTDYIQVGELPLADFDFTIDELQLTLNNTSTNADEIEWYIPALDQSSNQNQTAFSFPTAGTYLVQLTATNSCGSVTKEETITIGQALNANFSFTPTGACEQASVVFTDQSTGSIEAYSWEFPGGNPATSTVANPIISYENAGIYTVKLTVSGPLGQAEMIKEGAVEVLLRPNPNFSFTIDGLRVSFQNTSSDASRYNWSFGDGNSSSELNPTHVYSEPGLYDVSLNAQNQYCGLAASQAVFLKPNALTAIEADDQWLAYPNPFQHELFLSYQGTKPLSETTFLLYNDLGQLLRRGAFQQQTSISTAAFSPGVYWLKLTTADRLWWRKVVKTD